MLLGICDALVRLFFGERSPERGAVPDDEAAAVTAMYFRNHEIDTALVERLLWWEGVEAPVR